MAFSPEGVRPALSGQGGLNPMKHALTRKGLLCILLLALALGLCACAQGTPEAQDTPLPQQQDPLTVTDAPTDDPLPAGYDPTSEEDDGPSYQGGEYNEMGQAVSAGATAIPLDPIDMPTATPRPELTFTYTKVTLDGLGLTFEIPGTFVMDDSVAGQVTFTDPNTLDKVNATITVRIAAVASDYKVDDVKTELQNTLSAMGQYNYTKWEVSDPTARKLLNKDGYYADYRGVMTDGTIVRGRVQMSLLDDNRLLSVSMNCPGWFNTSYQKVFAQLRSTLESVTAGQ